MNYNLIFISVMLLGCSGLFSLRSTCESMQDPVMKDKCFSALAFSEINTTGCQEVQNSTMREYCVMRIAISMLSPSSCGDMETSLREQCVHVIMGLQENNSLVCNLIQDNDTADLCRMRVM